MSTDNLDIESDASRGRGNGHNGQYHRRASDEQKEHLVEFMSRNLAFANNISENSYSIVATKCERADLWQKLTNELNLLPGAYKDVARWKKCWVDLRINAKAKYKKIQQRKDEKIRTFGRDSLTGLDATIMRIIASCPASQSSDSFFEDAAMEIEKLEENNGEKISEENTTNIPENVTVKVEILEEAENSFNSEQIPSMDNSFLQKEKTPKMSDRSNNSNKKSIRKQKRSQIYKKIRREIADLKGTLIKELFQYKKEKLELERQKMQLEAERIQLEREQFTFKKYSIIERNKIESQKVNALINISSSINSLAERSAVFSVTDSADDFYHESEAEM